MNRAEKRQNPAGAQQNPAGAQQNPTGIQQNAAGAEMLRLSDLHTGYGEKEILSGITASIGRGELVGLIGANGAGKSTLLKCICGLVPVTAGNIVIEGKDSETLTAKERARHVAVVPQLYDIDYDFYVRDIVMMGRNPYRTFRDREGERDLKIVKTAMELTGTLAYADRYFSKLSGGEKQRVIIARAIAQQTDLMLLDEPTSALDLQHQIEIMELIVELNRTQGKTVVAVLHDLNLAARYCSRLILLHEGKILADGKPAEVLTQDNLQTLYKMQMIIRTNPVFARPEIIPIRVLNEKQAGQSKRIHMICGGGSGAKTMEALTNMGHRVSIGVINYGDDDWIMGRYLGIEMVTAGQFSDVTTEAQQENLALMKGADILYIANVPVGSSNIENLRGLLAFEGKILIHKGILENDFTRDGEAAGIVTAMTESGRAVWVESAEEMELHI